MQIKKYLAPTLKEAILKMKEELGEDAVILSTRVIPPIQGEAKMFELNAGIENDFSAPDPFEERPGKTDPKNFETELKKLTEKIYGTEPFLKPQRPVSSQRLKASDLQASESPFLKQGDFEEVRELLLDREVAPRVSDLIIEQLKKYNAFVTKENLNSYVISTISSMIPTQGFEVEAAAKPKVISLVGPTGVGKTTCIAKLAVISKIIHNLDVGLISIDTYRLGALDQLKIFSEVSNIDFLIAYEPKDIPRLMNKFRKKDLVFIDTVGRSQKNTSLLQGINDFLSQVKIDEIYLVLSAVTTSNTMIDVARKFKSLNYNGIVLTKLDEAVAYGNILNLLTETNVPVKYLTNGQVIPDDIIAADAEFVANMIYTGKIIK